MVYSKPPRFSAWSTPSSSGWRPPLATCARQQRRQLFWNWCHRRQSVYRSASLSWNGRVVEFAKTLNYKGMMYSDVPNLASSFGYTNASWTLKCDLTCEYVCRLINYTHRHE